MPQEEKRLKWIVVLQTAIGAILTAMTVGGFTWAQSVEARMHKQDAQIIVRSTQLEATAEIMKIQLAELTAMRKAFAEMQVSVARLETKFDLLAK